MASKDVSTMSVKELTDYIKELQSKKREKQGKVDREKVKVTFAPLFDAIDKAIASDAALKELIEEKDALRLYFDKAQKVNRDGYNSYAQREYNGDNGGQKQYKHRDHGDVWADVPNTTWKSACVKLNIPVKAQSAQSALNAKGYDTRIVDENGIVTSENKGK